MILSAVLGLVVLCLVITCRSCVFSRSRTGGDRIPRGLCRGWGAGGVPGTFVRGWPLWSRGEDGAAKCVPDGSGHAAQVAEE